MFFQDFAHTSPTQLRCHWMYARSLSGQPGYRADALASPSQSGASRRRLRHPGFPPSANWRLVAHASSSCTLTARNEGSWEGFALPASPAMGIRTGFRHLPGGNGQGLSVGKTGRGASVEAVWTQDHRDQKGCARVWPSHTRPSVWNTGTCRNTGRVTWSGERRRSAGVP